MGYKNYQEIVNTADCNAEVNFVGADGKQRVMGWAKNLIDTAWEARDNEIKEAEQRGIQKVVDDMTIACATGNTDMERLIALRDVLQGWQAFLKEVEK